jgi:hypothetical protein
MTGQPLVDHPLANDEQAALPPIADVYRWSVEQAAHLRAGRLDLLDIANVADEIEAVGRSEFEKLVSNLTIVLLHMLKWDHQPLRRSRSWALSIAEHRDRVGYDLRDSPSLRGRLSEAIARAYRFSRLKASSETDLDVGTFPVDCPYSEADLLQKPFIVDHE